MTEEIPPGQEASSGAEAAGDGRGTATRFFLLPLLVVATAVGIFWVFSRMTFERRSPADYLQEVRGGSANRRWQAAFELSRSLQNLDPAERAALAGETLRIFASLSASRPEDVPVRRYLALVLGKLGDRQAVDALVTSTEDPDADTRLYAVWALGKLGDPRALAAVTEASFSEDAGMRKMAAYVLGQLSDRAAAPRLRVLLGDSVADVRWNSAIALASLSDPSGLPVLRSMIDREALARQAALSGDQAETAMIGALKALALLRDEGSLLLLEKVSREDPNLRVRAAAREAIAATRAGVSNLERRGKLLIG
ncbi:MAG: HEAT repeat domain-containing protein [Thermoanaerobaculia bacterium]